MGGAATKQAPLTSHHESVDSVNTRLKNRVDDSLGFGFLDGDVKQRLVKAPYTSCVEFLDTTSSFSYSEDTEVTKRALHMKQKVAFQDPLSGEVSAHGEQAWQNHASTGQSSLTYTFKRIVAMREIAVPHFKTLRPVKKKSHVAGTRWMVELYGNEICTTEYYGGELSILFTWKRETNDTTRSVKAALQTAIAAGTLDASVAKSFEKSELTCRVSLRGFSQSESQVSLEDVMTLVRKIPSEPVVTVVPVDVKTVPIRNVEGFPSKVHVETKIHDTDTLNKLNELRCRLLQTGQEHFQALHLVNHLIESILDAAVNRRDLVPELRKLAERVLEAFDGHGTYVQLYQRKDKHRVHTRECSSSAITAAASESLMWITVGLGAIGVRGYQRYQFARADSWHAPNHFKTRRIETTGAFLGYYDREKHELLFDDDDQAAVWRSKIDELVHSAGQKNTSLLDRCLGRS